MPCYIVELNPPSLLPEPMPADATREMTNPDMLLRDINALEAALPGAKLRGIVLQPLERRELAHFIGDEPKELFAMPMILEWSRLP